MPRTCFFDRLINERQTIKLLFDFIGFGICFIFYTLFLFYQKKKKLVITNELYSFNQRFVFKYLDIF